MVIKSVAPLSVARLFGAAYAALGVLIGGVLLLAGLLGLAAMGNVAGAPNPGPQLALMGAAFLILGPIVYGVIGFVSGFVLAWMYNVLANVIGGIDLEFEHDVLTRD